MPEDNTVTPDIVKQIHAIPKSMIKWHIGRLHIATSDDEIIADVTARFEKSSATDYQKRRIVQYAVACHHRSQDTARMFRL